jgi:large subunit ribosomal protein L35
VGFAPAVAILAAVWHKARLPSPGRQGCRGGADALICLCSDGSYAHMSNFGRSTACPSLRPKETSQMPKIKMKTKSGVKKRFRLTASGKVVSTQANKRHMMIKRTNKQIRQQRGTTIMNPSDAKIVKKWMPYG